MDPAIWVAGISLLIAVLTLVAPITKTKVDDRLLDLLKGQVKPAVEKIAADKAKETVKAELKPQDAAPD